MPRLPTVAIVGRPNVGKSTLFNRLVGKKVALVDDRPGVTRDRREGEAKLLGLEFRVIDTAGYEDEDPHTLPGRMRQQTEAAVRDADVALFLIDAREGLTPLDEEIARGCAPAEPVILVANKAEGRPARPGDWRPITSASASPSRSAPSMATASATCSTPAGRIVERDEDEPRRGGRRGRSGPAAEARHRRPAECGQVDPAQPAARRRADDHRAGGRDHARFGHAGLGMARGGRCGWSTPRACRKRAKVDDKLEKLSAATRRRAIEMPRSSSCCSTRRAASRRRTCGSPT